MRVVSDYSILTARMGQAVMSGEMKDTADLGAVESYAVESLVSRQDRLSVMRTWSGLAALLPKGGEAIWGDVSMVQSSLIGSSWNVSQGVSEPQWSHLKQYEHNNNASATPAERRCAHILPPLMLRCYSVLVHIISGSHSDPYMHSDHDCDLDRECTQSRNFREFTSIAQ